MDELPPAVESWVHNNGHEIVCHCDLFEHFFEQRITTNSDTTDLFFKPFVILLRFVEVLRLSPIGHIRLFFLSGFSDELYESVEERLVSVRASKETDGASVLDKL